MRYELELLKNGQWKVTDLRTGTLVGLAPDGARAGMMIERRETALAVALDPSPWEVRS